MASYDSTSLCRQFKENVRDVTPPAARGAVRVLYSPVLPNPETTRLCLSILSDNELQRARRFTTKDDRIQFVQRRAFRRYCGALALGSRPPLSQIVFSETDKGRPYLPERPDLWLSFSSFRYGFLGAWSMTHGIGLDIEDGTRELETLDMAREFFSDAEASAVQAATGIARAQMFFQLWTLKEAALKSMGEGLPFGLSSFEFETSPLPRIIRVPPNLIGKYRFSAHPINGIRGCAALVTRLPLSGGDTTKYEWKRDQECQFAFTN